MATKGTRILVAEDQPAEARPIVAGLERAGHIVRWVRSVREVREVLPTERPAVLVLDVTLETNGLEYFQAIRFAAEQPAGGVVILTEPGDVPMRERAQQLGAAAVVSKPVDPDHLVSVVEDLLALT